MNKNRQLNQSQAVLVYLANGNKEKLTTSQITKGVNNTFKRKYTTNQVSKCLNKFKNDNIVSWDRKGTTSAGTPCYRWTRTLKTVKLASIVKGKMRG